MSLYLAIELDDKSKQLLGDKQRILKHECEKGDFDDPTRFHITIRFLSEDILEHEKAIEGMKLFEQRYNPKKFDIYSKGFYKFEQNTVWAGVHNSMEIYKIKYGLNECLEEAGFPLKKERFDGYVPHITMGFGVKFNLSEKELEKLFDEKIPITITNISLWNGFKANDTYIHNKLYGIDFK